MSSILKVDTIQDQNGNLIISKDSGGGGFEGTYFSSSSPKSFTVTVASKLQLLRITMLEVLTVILLMVFKHLS